MTYHLTPEATLKIRALNAALAELGLEINTAYSLALAQKVADKACEDREQVDEMLDAWAEDILEKQHDILCCVDEFLTED